MAGDGELDGEIRQRVQAGWRNWQHVLRALCDCRNDVKLKGRFY